MSTHREPARVMAVKDGLVTIESPSDGLGAPLTKNEVVYIVVEDGSSRRLKGEVLRVRGRQADVQVFEETAGVGVGDPVEQTGEMLSVALGPGLLGQVYDGLQSPLEAIAAQHGFFLPRGAEAPALDPNAEWTFVPAVQAGARLGAGDVVGTVQEGRFPHHIMLPFDQEGDVEVTWIQEGRFTHDVDVAQVVDSQGQERAVTLQQRWPVRRPLPQALLRRRVCERLYPDRPLLTNLRIIDTLFPIARGGTACIPGPFGAGKTVLQHLLARHSAVDIVIVVACGERAGEVVETIREFPKLSDPHGGGPLMDRTIVICNTSSMPVAAREASIYTGVTLGEYYRQMGYDVLLLADSTSRWAQAMREASGRMEEIPGDEAFPAYLDSSIRNIYERSGLIHCADDRVGSLTIIGTVSPAGGNFEEPVTQSTLATVKTFLGLSADRAYKRFYPAIDPLSSWSRYWDQLGPWYAREVAPDWVSRVQAAMDLLKRGDEVLQMMQVTGEEGVTLEDILTYQQALFLDTVYLQQDAFDAVDASVPLERQVRTLAWISQCIEGPFGFTDKEQVREHFTQLTRLFKNLNYCREDSPEHAKLRAQIDAHEGRRRPSTT